MTAARGACLLVALSVASAGFAAQSPEATEEALKAAFLYNFAKFVDWPPDSVSESTLVLCVSDRPFAALLETSIEGKQVQSRALSVRYWSPTDNAGGTDAEECNMLFVDSLSREQRRSALESMAGRSVLTVGASEDFAREGGIINIIKVADRLRFEVNPAAADRANLKISSKLLRLAEVIDE